MRVFSQEEDSRLISNVKEHPLLYDGNHEFYKDQHKREENWIQIASQLGKSVSNCKKHWRNLRDGYARYRRNIKAGHRMKYSKNKVKWRIYNQLSFLDSCFNSPSLNGEEIKVDFQDDDHEEDGDETTCEDPLVVADEEPAPDTNVASSRSKSNRVKLSPKLARRRVFVRKDEILEHMKRIEKSNEMLRKTVLEKQAQEYNLGSFAAHVQAVLKKINPLLQVEAKQELFAVLTKYELASVEYGPSSNMSSPIDGPSMFCEPFFKVEPM